MWVSGENIDQENMEQRHEISSVLQREATMRSAEEERISVEEIDAQMAPHVRFEVVAIVTRWCHLRRRVRLLVATWKTNPEENKNGRHCGKDRRVSHRHTVLRA